jgi:hypothetical protein
MALIQRYWGLPRRERQLIGYRSTERILAHISLSVRACPGGSTLRSQVTNATLLPPGQARTESGVLCQLW